MEALPGFSPAFAGVNPGYAAQVLSGGKSRE
jgi:hypothetical protein